MKKTRRKFDSEFKRQAIKMVTDDGKSCRAVERDLGLGAGILYRWVREAKTDPQHCFLGNGKVKPSPADVNALLKEVEHLRRQRDILKKALAIFSQITPRSAGSSPGMQRI
jgi:transposase